MAPRSDSISGVPVLVERTGVDGSHDVEEAGRVTFVDRVSLDWCQLDAVERLGNDVVHQQSLHDRDDLTDSSGRKVTVSERREAARCGVVIERVVIHGQMFPQLPGLTTTSPGRKQVPVPERERTTHVCRDIEHGRAALAT